jgi:hypothetical protein
VFSSNGTPSGEAERPDHSNVDAEPRRPLILWRSVEPTPSLRLLVPQALGGTNGSSAVGIHPDRQRGGYHRPFIGDRRWNLVHGVASQWRDVGPVLADCTHQGACMIAGILVDIACDPARRAQTPPLQNRTRLCRQSNRSLSARRIPAGKRFGEVRDRAGIFGANSVFRATETGLSGVSSAKAAES